jgi:hypothetical protein
MVFANTTQSSLSEDVAWTPTASSACSQQADLHTFSLYTTRHLAWYGYCKRMSEHRMDVSLCAAYRAVRPLGRDVARALSSGTRRVAIRRVAIRRVAIQETRQNPELYNAPTGSRQTPLGNLARCAPQLTPKAERLTFDMCTFDFARRTSTVWRFTDR